MVRILTVVAAARTGATDRLATLQGDLVQAQLAMSSNQSLAASLDSPVAEIQNSSFGHLESVMQAAASKVNEMSLEEALTRLEDRIPANLKVGLTGEMSLLQMESGPDAVGHVAGSAFEKAVGFIDEELEGTIETMDQVLFSCSYFKVNQEAAVFENAQHLMHLGGEISTAQAKISEANGVLTQLSGDIGRMGEELGTFKDACKETEREIRARKKLLTEDQLIASHIQGIAEGECDKKLLLVEACEVDGHSKITFGDNKLQTALSQMQSGVAKQAAELLAYHMFEGKLPAKAPKAVVAALNSNMDKVSDELYNEELANPTMADDMIDDDDMDGGAHVVGVDFAYPDEEDMGAFQDEQQGELENGQAMNAAMGAAFVQKFERKLRHTPPGGRCSTSGKPDCGILLDKLLNMVGDIRDSIHDTKAELAAHLADCALQVSTMQAQIDAATYTMNQYNVILMEATAKLLKNTSAQSEAYIEKHELCSSLRERYTKCHDQIEKGEATSCALLKVRQAIFKKMKGKDPLIQDCEVSEWTANKCSKECDDMLIGGTQSVTRTIITSPSQHGAKCPPLVMERVCGNKPCPVHCEVSDWSDHSQCSKDCGGGTRSRSRTTTLEPAHGGEPCPELSEAEVCNTQSCDVDCTLRSWAEWSSCNKACRVGNSKAGARFRRRHIHRATKGQGKCPKPNSRQRLEHETCNDHPCPDRMECTAKLDVMVLLDGSGSVANSDSEQQDLNFQMQKEFTRRLINDSVMAKDFVGSPSNLQYGLIQYSGWRMCSKVVTRYCEHSSYIRVVHDLSPDKKSILQKLAAEKWMKGGTYIHDALTTAKTLLRQSDASRHATIILITDGRPSDLAKTNRAAKDVRDAGIRLIVVPVKRFLSNKMVCKWASRPCSENVIRSTGWKGLINKLREYQVSMCPEVSPIAIPKAETQACDDTLAAYKDKTSLVPMDAAGCIPGVPACKNTIVRIDKVPEGCQVAGTVGFHNWVYKCDERCKCAQLCTENAECREFVFSLRSTALNCYLYLGKGSGRRVPAIGATSQLK